MLHITYITLCLLKSVKLEIPLDSIESEESIMKNTLFPKNGPVFMRKVYTYDASQTSIPSYTEPTIIMMDGTLPFPYGQRSTPIIPKYSIPPKPYASNPNISTTPDPGAEIRKIKPILYYRQPMYINPFPKQPDILIKRSTLSTPDAFSSNSNSAAPNVAISSNPNSIQDFSISSNLNKAVPDPFFGYDPKVMLRSNLNNQAPIPNLNALNPSIFDDILSNTDVSSSKDAAIVTYAPLPEMSISVTQSVYPRITETASTKSSTKTPEKFDPEDFLRMFTTKHIASSKNAAIVTYASLPEMSISVTQSVHPRITKTASTKSSTKTPEEFDPEDFLRIFTTKHIVQTTKRTPFTVKLYPDKQMIYTRTFKPEQSTQFVEKSEQIDEDTDPFSMFLRKLLKILAAKNVQDLQKLIKACESYITTLVDSGKLMKLGSPTTSYIAQQTPLLRTPTEELQRQMFIEQISLEYRRKMLSDGVNTMLDDMDDLYDVNEEEAMQRVLTEVRQFPDISKSAEQIVQDFISDVFVRPMHRVAGTARGRILFERIAKIAGIYDAPYARRFQEANEENKFVETSAINKDRGKRYTKEIFVGHKPADLPSISQFLGKENFPKMNKEMVFVEQFSTRKGPSEYDRKHGCKTIKESKLKQICSINEDGKSDSLSSDDDGIDIRIKIKQGKYSKNNKQIRRNSNLGKRNIKEKPTREKKVLTNNTNKSEVSRRNARYKYGKLKISVVDSSDSDDNTKILKKGAEDKHNSGNLSRKSINKEYILVKKSDSDQKEHRVLKTKRNEVNRRNMSKNKTKVKYDCKPLPLIAKDKKGMNTNKTIAEDMFSEMVIYCGKASNSSNI